MSMTEENTRIEAKEIIGQQIKESGYTSGTFEINGYRIAWDLSIEIWKE